MPQKKLPKIAVIGAGMSGILTGIRLQQAGIDDYTIYEKADRLGGTWRENTYPGLTCDIPSHLYSYSFELNPDWTRKFSPGAEICAYFRKVAEKYRVDAHIQYGKEITLAEMRDGRWHLSCHDSPTETYDFVIAATGVLHKPVYPDIAGLADFAGPMFHTARWDHSVVLDGKRVGIIGTGSTAIQIVPAIIDKVNKLSLFQRTPQWIFPIANPPYSEADKQSFRKNPAIVRKIRQSNERQIYSAFARAVIGDREQLQILRDACAGNLNDNVTDPELKAKLTPNYEVACKRLIMSDEFYPAIQKENAELVTESIERIEAGGVRTGDDRLHPLDVLVLATGFDGHNFMKPMEIVGPTGQRLSEIWAEVTPAYRSVALPGFPNFFMLLGPNSPIGNFSLIEVSERQTSYILKIIEDWRGGAFAQAAPSQTATDAFNAELRAAMTGTVWVSGCRSWYLDKNGDPAMWPFTFERFCDDMAGPVYAEFDCAS